MLLISLFGISVVAGTVLGVVWRLIDDWQERRQIEMAQNTHINT